MKPDDKPKYLNTSESDLFHKGRIVYGADLARAAAAKAGRVVLVEGYTDVIALHQAGVPEVVAQMGTALTDAQVDAIARLAPKALFCQDPDRAGQESVAKGIAALRTHNKGRTTRGVEFRIVRLPAGQDPADVAQQSGGEVLRGLLDKAVAIEKFEVERALEQPDASADEMLATVAPIIAPLPASILKDELVGLVSGRLGMSAGLVNEALRAPFTASSSRDDLRGGGMPGRGGNPPRSGWSRGGGSRSGSASAPGGHGGGQGARDADVGGGRQGERGAGGAPGRHARGTNGAPGQPGQEARDASGAPGRAGHGAGGSGAPGRDARAANGAPGEANVSGSGQAPSRGEGPADRGGDARSTAHPVAPHTSGPDDPFVDGPPPPEWDGFSGDDDFDPGAMGAPPDWTEPAGASSSASGPAPTGGAVPPPVGEPPAWEHAPPPAWGPPQDFSRDREWQPRGGGRGGGQRGGGRYRGGGRDNRDRYRRNDPPPEPVDPRFAINRGQRQEHTFLAFCIALPEQGERRLEALDVDDYFSAPATRQAAAYLRGRLRSPTAHLPAGDEALARLVAKLVVDSDRLEATPAKFELEGLQLELHRLERRISSARVSGATGVHDLAVERQRVLDEIRHKLS
jgi:hypothetical protein